MSRSAAVLILLLFPVLTFAQPFQWMTFTSTSNVVEMTVLDGRIWTATSGGLSVYDPATQAFDVYTNTRGLAMNQCVAIGSDIRGFVWAAHADARITRLHPATGLIVHVNDLQGEIFETTDILNVGDEVFVGTNNGIYRFSYFSIVDNYRVRESIRALGTFPGETRVSCVGTDGVYLYAGTQFGLARARLSQPQLSAPAAWENWTTANGLPENNIVAMRRAADGDRIFVATPSWLFTIDGNAVVEQHQIGGVRAFSDGSGELATTAQQIFFYDSTITPSGTHWWSLPNGAIPGIGDVDGIGESSSFRFVAGLENTSGGIGGIRIGSRLSVSDTVSWSATLRAPGIGGNYITSLAMDPQGRLWAGGSKSAPGLFVKSGESWNNYSVNTGYTHDFMNADHTGIVFDNSGGAWVSSAGRGVAWFRGDSVLYFNTRDSSGFALVNGQLKPRFSGIGVDPHYAECYLTRNSAGDIYISNLEAANGLSVMRVSREWISQGNNTGVWTYYSPRMSGTIADYPRIGQLLTDPYSRIWAGAARNGTRSFVIDENGTPSDTSNDVWFAYQPSDLQDPVTCYEDINKEVLTWTVDAQGYLWIGTINGAYYSQGGVPGNLNQLRFVCVVDLPVGRRVNAIHVDAHDNKWFGTDEGVAVLDKNFMWIHVFQNASSAYNRSDLVANNVLAITSDARTGDVWIGTSDGLSRFASPYVSTGGDFGDLWPFPNPFRADGSQRLRVDPQKLGGRFDDFRIYTISGRLVRKLGWLEMTDPRATGGWDGRNDDGEFAAGGVYLLVATSNDGKSAVGKVAVLGR